MKNLPETITPKTLGELETFAQMACASGYFADARDAAQAMVKIAAGLEMGIAPIQAMTSIHVIKGRVTLSANLMAAQVRRAGYRYQVQWSDGACSITFCDGEQVLGESSFSMADAKQAGLSGGGWQKYPRNMLFARAMMNGVRWYLPELALGIYDPEEVGAETQDQSESWSLSTGKPYKGDLPEGELPEIPLEDEYDPKDEAQVIEAEVIDDGSHPGENWNAANRGLMAVANSAGLTREELRSILGVESLKECTAKQMNIASIKCQGYHFWRDGLDDCKSIEDLRSAWTTATQELPGGWKVLAAKAKNARKAQLSA